MFRFLTAFPWVPERLKNLVWLKKGIVSWKCFHPQQQLRASTRETKEKREILEKKEGALNVICTCTPKSRFRDFDNTIADGILKKCSDSHGVLLTQSTIATTDLTSVPLKAKLTSPQTQNELNLTIIAL